MQTHQINNIRPVQIPAEYKIYAYNKYSKDMIGYNKWQCLSSGQDASQVLLEAERLFDSNEFQKIEVMKKFFDDKENKPTVATFRVYETKSKKTFLFGNQMMLATIFLIAALFLGLFMLEKL